MTILITPSVLLKTEASKMPISVEKWEMKPIQHGQFYKKRIIATYNAYTNYSVSFHKRIV